MRGVEADGRAGAVVRTAEVRMGAEVPLVAEYRDKIADASERGLESLGERLIDGSE